MSGCSKCGIMPATVGDLCAWCHEGGEIEVRGCGNRRCKSRFMVHVKGGARVYCTDVCKKRGNAQNRYKRQRARMFAPLTGTDKREVGPQLAAAILPKCALCLNGRKSSNSDIGWECRKSAILCRPFGEAKYFEKR